MNRVEIWRPIPEFEGRYEVSTLGRVRSVHRLDGRPRLLKLRPVPKGYLRVGLRRGGRQYDKGVHVWVALAFLGPRPPGRQVRHLDGNPANNFVENLAWGTPSENNRDTVRHGRHHNAQKTHCIRGHEFTPENTERRVRPSWVERRCRACRRLEDKRRVLA